MRLLPTERDIQYCHSKPEIRQIMDIGIFILRVAADCRVQGRNWTLPGVAYLQAQLAITPAILTHLPLNISTLVPQELSSTRTGKHYHTLMT